MTGWGLVACIAGGVAAILLFFNSLDPGFWRQVRDTFRD